MAALLHLSPSSIVLFHPYLFLVSLLCMSRPIVAICQARVSTHLDPQTTSSGCRSLFWVSLPLSRKTGSATGDRPACTSCCSGFRRSCVKRTNSSLGSRGGEGGNRGAIAFPCCQLFAKGPTRVINSWFSVVRAKPELAGLILESQDKATFKFSANKGNKTPAASVCFQFQFNWLRLIENSHPVSLIGARSSF